MHTLGTPVTAMALALAIGGLASGCSAENSDGEPAPGGGQQGERGPIGKADSTGSCAEPGVCGGPSSGSCWCDEQCATYGDCCDDYEAACGTSGGCSSDAECGAAECVTGVCVEPASIRFDADWSESVSGTLVAGATIAVDYDEERLTQCRGNQGGNPAWTIYGYARVNGGEKKPFWVAGHSSTGQTQAPNFVAPEAGELEIWFENTNLWGCIAYDSNEGQNYRFEVTPLGG